MRSIRHPFCVAGVAILLHGACVAHAQARVDEPTMKAVAFEQVSRFIRWPAGSTSENSFIIGLVGRNSVTERVKTLYEGRKIQDRTVEIRHITSPEDATTCQLVYIADTKNSILSRIRSAVAGLPVLTVSDLPDATESNALLNLYIQQDRLRFEINEKGFHLAGLEVDPLLLKVARIVNPKKGTP